MTEEEIKQAICQVVGKDESGTGWLIAADKVLTAYHCVQAAAIVNEPVTVRFGIGLSVAEYEVSISAVDEDLDVCLLQLSTRLDVKPIPMEPAGLRPGEQWFSFGYPVVKLQLGHFVKGQIQQVLPARVHGVDLDLSVEEGTRLSEYLGLSGSPLVVGNACKGLLRINIDKAIGAVSLTTIEAFLAANGFNSGESSDDDEGRFIGRRPEFDSLFESTISTKRSGYVFVDGSHGVGKSTYCDEFIPKLKSLEKLGVYHFTERSRGSVPAHQAQPEVFFDWVNSIRSMRASGKPARLVDFSYSQIIEKIAEIFQSLAARCAEIGKIGVLFIDGINEAAAAGDETLSRFVNLLPPSIPDGLVVVVTGVGLDAVAGRLGVVFQGAGRLTLPSLDRDVQYGVCYEFLHEDKATTEVVAALCDRALGHPLYLRYLADLVNSGATVGDIAELPVFSGSIQDYYESIWSKLLPNADVINLLGIIARLRWGIPASALTSMLTPSEAGVYPATLLRVRHLLANPGNTEIYHPSFSEFVVHKTALITEWVQSRLAEYCRSAASGDYGLLNRIFHGLRAGVPSQLLAVQDCQQAWVDESVLLGAEPDVLLADIDETLAAATTIGTATDTIRLLLLSQRLTFRYNTLFAQSAELVALALISLGKTDSALRHIVRNGQIIVSLDQAFIVVDALTKQGSSSQAMAVLELVQREISTVFEKWKSEGEISVREFFMAVVHRLHAFSLAYAAGERPPLKQFFGAIVRGIVDDSFGKFSSDQQEEILRMLTGEMLGARLSFDGRYTPFEQLNLPFDVDLRRRLLDFLHILARAEINSEKYGAPLNREMVGFLLSDIEKAIGAQLRPADRQFGFADTLIAQGCSPVLVNAYYQGADLGDESLPFFERNRAEPDEDLFETAMLRVRASFFLEGGYAVPAVQMPSQANWEETIEAMARAVAWADGKGRRALAAKELSDLDAVIAFVFETLLPCFAFNLESRIAWESSYSIPETVVPRLYLRIAKLTLDCFPGKLLSLLEAIERGFGTQFGLYNEGFRKVLQEVLSLFVKHDVKGEAADKVFSLVLLWRDYVAENVENRFELVPELLQVVPILSKLQAEEEALATYRLALSFSMGPSWYKEDQLSMMSSTLEALPSTSPISPEMLAQIAALLERATGEMTFQRFIRADKGNFIGQLCRRTLFMDAVKYFQHQSCGTSEQLFLQATSGNLDRVSELVGMKFPGAALEEPSALLAVLRNNHERADWRFRWALLEIYQHSDERHLADWGRAYATIISELMDNDDNLKLVMARVRSIVTSLNSEQAWLLLRSLVSALSPGQRSNFSSLLNDARSKLKDAQVERLTSSFGLRDTEDNKSTEEDAEKEIKVKPSNANEPEKHKNADDDRFYMPGTFGKRNAVSEANERIDDARTNARRRNFSAAIRDCIDALKILQAGGWSIWSSNHAGREADELISAHTHSADELVRQYGPLAVAERHTQRWVIASHLISIVGNRVSEAQQMELLAVVTDHVRIIVGEASSTSFEYFGNSGSVAASDALLELLLWTLDHPSWERRDAAADMTLWVARISDDFLSKLAPLAISMDMRNRADIASAILDILSREDSNRVWRNIEPYVDMAQVLEKCQHLGRFSTFMRVVERASKCGIESASTAFSSLQERFASAEPISAKESFLRPPSYVPQNMYRLWGELLKLGVLTEETIQMLTAKMVECCLPLSVEKAAKLESLVAEGGREDSNLPTGRWSSLVRYALNIAMFRPMHINALKKVEVLLRAYNPESLIEPENGRIFTDNLVAFLKSQGKSSYRPSYGDLVFLDFQSFLELGQRNFHVELTSHLVPPNHRQPVPPAAPAFRSTELPRPGADEPIAVCGRVMPTVAYFGSITPAIPTPRFLQLIRASASSTFRYHWRDGGTLTSIDKSRRQETTLLAITRSALSLPDGWNLQWALRVNGQLCAVFHDF